MAGASVLRRKVAKYTFLTFLAAIIISVMAVSAVFWRLSQGPVALTFLKDTIVEQINTNMSGISVRLEDVIIEQDEATKVPKLRLRGVSFHNKDGRLIARAPRAAVIIDKRSLLYGSVVARELELIGARLLVRRSLDGSIGLGFGKANSGNQPVDATENKPETIEQINTLAKSGELISTQVSNLFDYLDASNKKSSVALSKLESVRISKAAITLYDEQNDAVWYAPTSNLVFRRAPYGFALFADARISGRTKPWRIEFTAHFQAESRKTNVSARIFDLIPSELARDVFALSQLAQIQLPLSGHGELELLGDGKVTRASAELSAAVGRVGFPGYIAKPIIIDEGLVRLDLDPQTGNIIIADSTITVGGTPAQLTGRIYGQRNSKDQLAAIGIELDAKNVSIDATANVSNPVNFKQVSFKGVASLEQPRLMVDDLILMTGEAGIRMRGQFLGGKDAAGVFLGGRIRDLSVGTIKKLWPPIVASVAHDWINEHVIKGRISKGEFRVAIPADIIAAAINGKPVPDDMVDFKFSMTDVSTRYYREMPALAKASGTARLTGDRFSLKIDRGTARLPSKRTVSLKQATMDTSKLAAPLSPTVIKVKLAGSAKALMELINHKPLKLLEKTRFKIDRISGDGTLDVKLTMPLSRNLTEADVGIQARAKWTKAKFEKAVENLDLTDGNIEIIADKKRIKVFGKAKINEIPASIVWSRNMGNKNKATISLKAKLTESRRAELGIDLSRYVRGEVAVDLTATIVGGAVTSARVKSDLGNAILALDEIDWVHAAGKKTKASFDVEYQKNGRKIKNLVITGEGLTIKGSMLLDKSGNMIKASFPVFNLDKTNKLAVSAVKTKKAINIIAKGDSFDARTLIRQSFSQKNTRSRNSDAKTPAKAVKTSIRLEIGRVIANRGENIYNVKGTIHAVAGKVKTADLRGTFSRGSPVALLIRPNAKGGRNLQFTSGNAGAALRAANLYSKISGGSLSLQASLVSGDSSGIEKGLLILRNFIVRNENALDNISKTRKAKKKSGPRRYGLKFSKLKLPFSTDNNYVRIGDALVSGPEIGASANGRIRKSDGAMDIGGTIIPAYALNAALSEVPLLGQILTGGKGQGVFGLTYAIRGTMRQPKFVVNPVSAIAPGFLRQIFAIGGGDIRADGTAVRKRRKGRTKFDK